ncbi:TetR family transcriptional regulator [Glaciihabitans sp. dw_435]|uniref:TetR family transcriptional regulator n=1 Tax=Glaciihabitans sp. dw_435 TaxID=2720081 RepID=UPI001BD52568|nr:TetR family transcriptional regulator [Glaciihabitans sp. dw_435]
MNSEGTVRADLRELGKSAIRAEVAQRAIALLDERGFDQTTVEDIAIATGISPRSFFRYFPTKEDVVIGDLMAMGLLVEAALRERPADESPWAALRASLEPLVRTAAGDPANVLRTTRVAMSTAGLRARSIERHTAWAAVLTPIVEERLTATSAHPSMAAGALAQSALACLFVATAAWAEADGADSYGDLLDEAFAAVGTL